MLIPMSNWAQFAVIWSWAQVYGPCQPHAVSTHLPLDKMAAILEDIFKCIFVNENDRIPFQISLKFVPGGPIDNNPALV